MKQLRTNKKILAVWEVLELNPAPSKYKIRVSSASQKIKKK